MSILISGMSLNLGLPGKLSARAITFHQLHNKQLFSGKGPLVMGGRGGKAILCPLDSSHGLDPERQPPFCNLLAEMFGPEWASPFPRVGGGSP